MKKKNIRRVSTKKSAEVEFKKKEAKQRSKKRKITKMLIPSFLGQWKTPVRKVERERERVTERERETETETEKRDWIWILECPKKEKKL